MDGQLARRAAMARAAAASRALPATTRSGTPLGTGPAHAPSPRIDHGLDCDEIYDTSVIYYRQYGYTPYRKFYYNFIILKQYDTQISAQ